MSETNAPSPATDAASTGSGTAREPKDPLTRLGRGKVLLVFTASWCVPGQLLDDILAPVTADGVKIRVVDIDTWPHHAESFRILVLPTFVGLTAGSEKRRHLGAADSNDLLRLFR